MKKILFIIVAFLAFAMYTSYTSANDCDFVLTYKDGNFDVLKNWKYENILPKNALQQAMINLKSFCCDPAFFVDKSNTTNCTTDNAIKKDGIYPSSTYLYDHILDVSMRRLDAKQENENGVDLIYGLEPDKKGKEWREFITKQANSKDGSVPLIITNKFKENREDGKHSLVSWTSNKSKDDMPWGDKEFKEYDTRKLSDKYKGICESSIYLYLNLPIDDSDIDLDRLSTAYKKCEIMSDVRIKKEFSYTKMVLMQKGNKLLYNNTKKYLDNYFVQNKLVALQQLVFNIKNTFNEINRAVLKLVANCT